MGNTIVLVIRKSDNKVMPLRQSAPRHVPGRMKQNTIDKYGGKSQDFFEMIVPPEDTMAVLEAKELIYDPATEQLEIVDFDNKEKQLRHKEPELKAVEEQLIDAHVRETAALELGMNANRYAGIKTSLMVRRDALIQQIDNLKSG